MSSETKVLIIMISKVIEEWLEKNKIGERYSDGKLWWWLVD